MLGSNNCRSNRGENTDSKSVQSGFESSGGTGNSEVDAARGSSLDTWAPLATTTPRSKSVRRRRPLRSRGIEWDRDVQRRPAAGWTHDPNSTAEGLDPVFEPEQPGALPHVGSADSVVVNRQREGVILRLSRHGHLGGPRVLGGVGQCFGHNVIRTDFDGVGQAPVDLEVEGDRDG